MSLASKQISLLQALLRGQSVAWTSLNDNLRQVLINEELLNIIVNGTRKKLVALYPDRLQQFLEQEFEELRGVNWASDDLLSATSRAELASASGNSKTKMIRTCPGFLVNCYDPIHDKLNGKDFIISPQFGSLTFITDWEHFEVAANTLIVGVENMENFRMIANQKYLFPNIPILFVSRYPQSTDLRMWLQRIPNQYIHFGDFDLAGIHIYETEFYKHLGERASFFIPQDIKTRLSHGSVTRYNKQYQQFKNYTPADKRLLSLYKMIKLYHRCYDQEGYIDKKEIQL